MPRMSKMHRRFALAKWYLYVIEFPNEKRYFGVTRNVDRRFLDHHGEFNYATRRIPFSH